MQQTQQEILQFLMNLQAKQAKEPSPTIEPANWWSIQGVTPTTNADNLSAIGRQLVSTIEEPATFMTSAEIEIMLRKENEKASTSTVGPDLNPPYPAEILTNLIQLDTLFLNFTNSTEVRGTLMSTLWILLTLREETATLKSCAWESSPSLEHTMHTRITWT